MTRWETTMKPAAVDRLVAIVRQRIPEMDVASPMLIGEGISTLTVRAEVIRRRVGAPRVTTLSRTLDVARWPPA